MKEGNDRPTDRSAERTDDQGGDTRTDGAIRELLPTWMAPPLPIRDPRSDGRFRRIGAISTKQSVINKTASSDHNFNYKSNGICNLYGWYNFRLNCKNWLDGQYTVYFFVSYVIIISSHVHT